MNKWLCLLYKKNWSHEKNVGLRVSPNLIETRKDHNSVAIIVPIANNRPYKTGWIGRQNVFTPVKYNITFLIKLKRRTLVHGVL